MIFKNPSETEQYNGANVLILQRSVNDIFLSAMNKNVYSRLKNN